MSDVLIKNIQIPKDNKRLALFIDKDGDVTVFDGNEFNRITDAIEVLTPHGRLGDMDKLYEVATAPYGNFYGFEALIRDIKNAPTVIEASCENS